MSKLDEKIEQYNAEFKKIGVKDVDQAALRGVAKACGPSIYNADASKVSSSDEKELDRVKTNFCKNKLGINDDAKIDAAVSKVVDTFGSSNKSKYRAMFYYMLADHFGKLGNYK